jgi:hypothetical protein
LSDAPVLAEFDTFVGRDRSQTVFVQQLPDSRLCRFR